MHLKKQTVIGVLAGITLLGAGASTFAATPGSQSAPQPAPHQKHPHHRLPGAPGVIQSVDSSSVVVQLHRKHHAVSRTLALSQVSVRAGFYPSSSRILKTGEHVRLIGGMKSSPVLVVMPAVSGSLAQQGSTWTVTNKKGTVSLSATPSVLYGMGGLSVGQKAQVFGVRSSNTVVNPVAIGALPNHWVVKVTGNQNGVLTLQSTTHGTLTFNSATLPQRWATRLAKIKTNRRLIAIVSPSNNQVLMVMPIHHQRQLAKKYWALNTTAAGQLTGVNPTQLTLSNKLGTTTIPLSGNTVKIAWRGHTNTSVTQLPTNIKVLVHRNAKSHTLFIRVMG